MSEGAAQGQSLKRDIDNYRKAGGDNVGVIASMVFNRTAPYVLVAGGGALVVKQGIQNKFFTPYKDSYVPPRTEPSTGNKNVISINQPKKDNAVALDGSKNSTFVPVKTSIKTTVIGRMDDIKKYSNDPTVDTWEKSGLMGQRVTWSENKAWLDERINRGDDFGLATDPTTLPPVVNGYIPNVPNGYFTARELNYLQSKFIPIIPFYSE